MKRSLPILFLTSCILLGCQNKPEDKQISPSPVLNDISYCQAAETKLAELGCIAKDGSYTVTGKHFSQFCKETMTNGIALYPKCISEITTCNQANVCVQGIK